MLLRSGKSTVGRLLGAALQYPFLDTDTLIERASGKTVPEIFAEEGEESFRATETQILQARRPLPPLPHSISSTPNCHSLFLTSCQARLRQATSTRIGGVALEHAQRRTACSRLFGLCESRAVMPVTRVACSQQCELDGG